MTLQSGMIDLSSYTADDLVVKNVTGGGLAIQTEGIVTLSVAGKHGALTTLVNLGLVNLTTLSKVDTITEAGAYVCSVTGLDEIHFTVSGSGKIHWKELGD